MAVRRDVDALEQLIDRTRPLVDHLAWYLSTLAHEVEDLRQVGVVGVIKAAYARRTLKTGLGRLADTTTNLVAA